MPKQRTAVEMRDYQRRRRERLRVPAGVIAVDEPPARPVVDPNLHVPEPSVEPAPAGPRRVHRFVTGETLGHAVSRPRVVLDQKFPSGFHYLAGDHAPGRMTQGARDAILTRP